MGRTTYVGRCVECNCALYYSESEEKLLAKGGEPGCLHHYDWPEDREEEKKDGTDKS